MIALLTTLPSTFLGLRFMIFRHSFGLKWILQQLRVLVSPQMPIHNPESAQPPCPCGVARSGSAAELSSSPSACPTPTVPDSWKASIDFAAISDVGMRRSNNQDSHMVVTADSRERFITRGHLFVVADGMGAHAAGELASRIAAEQIPMYYLRQAGGDPAAALRDAVQQANVDIHQRGQQNPEFYNMGTTASTLAILPDGALIAHVGDSRVYRLRHHRLEQMTFDHSLVWEMQASGQVKPESQLCQAIPKNVITRSLGPSPSVVVDLEGPFALQKGDRFLLCSDGLTGHVEDAELGPLLAALPPQLATRLLVDLANLRGGTDNITAIVVDILADSEQGGLRQRRPSAEAVPWPLLASVGICLFAATLLGLSGSIGPMIVALVLGSIAAAVAATQYHRRVNRPLTNLAGAHPARHRTGPYRSFPAKPTAELLEQLDQVIAALKTAAQERQWKIDWKAIDIPSASEPQLRDPEQLAEATRRRAEAIVETMKQLRNQQRSAPPVAD